MTGGDEQPASGRFPKVHRVASLLKRWLLGTHQGAVKPSYLDYYLDEFTFRFNRRTSRSREIRRSRRGLEGGLGLTGAKYIFPNQHIVVFDCFLEPSTYLDCT